MVIRFIAILLLMPLGAKAQTTGGGSTNTNLSELNRITGASRVAGRFAGDNNQQTTFIYGGLAGSSTGACSNDKDVPCCGPASPGTSVCNNCNGDLNSCNARRVHDSAQLTIEFRAPTDPDLLQGGVPFIINQIDFGQAGHERLTATTSGTIIAQGGELVSVTVTWAEICNKLFNATSSGGCEDANVQPGAVNVRLGIDHDGNGQADETTLISEAQIILADLDEPTQDFCQNDDTVTDVCNFQAFPGDKKVFIEALRADCEFPSSVGSGTASGIRVFYETAENVADGNRPDNGSPSKDLTIATPSGTCSNSREISLSENEVDGLTNGQTYMFTIGLLDEANNLGGMIDPMGDPTIPASETDSGSCFTPVAGEPNCHYTTPDQVIGLIEKEFDCFIATAAFGSPLQAKVQDFRKFRNQFLHPSWIGQKIIKFYYRNSPPVARWIEAHPQVKPLAQVLLYPMWLFAIACLQSPLLVMLALLGLLGFVLRRSFRKGVQ